jgi:hypothetical protein
MPADAIVARPLTAILGGQPFLDTDYQQSLLSVDPSDPANGSVKDQPASG